MLSIHLREKVVYSYIKESANIDRNYITKSQTYTVEHDAVI
jgi:hypothetical protein